MDGVFTVHPSLCSVPSARSTKAQSMQLPPARAEASRVISSSPVLAPPGGISQVEALVHQFTQTQAQGQTGGR